MHWNGSWHMGWMSLWWILIVAVLVLVIWCARSATRRRDISLESPEQVLKRRYAKGEVDREAYERMLADLRK